MNKKEKIAALKDLKLHLGWRLLTEDLEGCIKDTENKILWTGKWVKEPHKNEKVYTYYDVMRASLDHLNELKDYPDKILKFLEAPSKQMNIKDNIH